MDAFGIFEGGGAKGLAHVGALKAAEQRNVKFVGVAGSSAGAIISALVAAGYRADDLYNPKSSSVGILDKNFLDFFDAAVMHQLRSLVADAKDSLGGRTMGKIWLKAPFFYHRNRKILDVLQQERGFFAADEFISWLDSQLNQKLLGGAGDRQVLFREVPIPLKIIATDVSNHNVRVFSQEQTPEVPVSVGVAASISIPLFFKPQQFEGCELVDGGVLSNFPAWVFDEERYTNTFTPTFGFRLVEVIGLDHPSTPTLLTFLRDLFQTVISGDPQLEVRQIENLHAIPLKVKVRTFDFGMDDSTKENLYVFGKDGVRDFFEEYIGPSNEEDLHDALGVIYEMFLNVLRGIQGEEPTNLRINIVVPVERERLRVRYTFNMDNDADDRLEFKLNAGASGRCWQEHDFVISDLSEASGIYQKEFGMDKYQLALIRPTLKSLLSVPIFDPKEFDTRRPKEENPMLGVLNFDSDDDLLEAFSDPVVQGAARDGAKFVAKALRP